MNGHGSVSWHRSNQVRHASVKRALPGSLSRTLVMTRDSCRTCIPALGLERKAGQLDGLQIWGHG